MDVWKYKIISRVEQDMMISWSTLKMNFIFPHIHVLSTYFFVKLFRETIRPGFTINFNV